MSESCSASEDSSIQRVLKPSGKKRRRENTSPDEALLSELECPVCKKYLTAPIAICQRGHSICTGCKDRVNQCPTCQSPFSSGRNFIVEKLSEKINCYCPNKDIGCNVVVTVNEVKSHQSSCLYSEQPCLLRCGWKGRWRINFAALQNHILHQHRSNVIEVGSILSNINKFNGFMVYMDAFFCIMVRRYNSTVKISLTQLNPLDIPGSFIYCVDIYRNLGTAYPKLSISNYCRKCDKSDRRPIDDPFEIPKQLLDVYKFDIKSIVMKVNLHSPT